MCCGGEGGGRQGRWWIGGRGVSHIGAGIKLSASCSLPLFHLKLFLLFQFMVWNLTEVSVCI